MQFLVAPWEHQKQAIDKARELDYFALFFEQGCGKTSTLINILREKYRDEKSPFRTLILCPPIVIDNWRREILRYSNIPPEKIITVTGTARTRLKTLDFPRDAIYISNYQTLLMEPVFRRLLNFGFRCVVLDESHKIKTYNSKTTKRVMAISQYSDFRYCLTGTPILNTAFDIYSQIKFLDAGARFGGFTDFRQAYFHDFNAGMPRHVYFPNWKIKPESTERINAAIAPISMRVLKKDCLDLPPLIRQRIDCELTPEQRKVYDELEKEFVAELSNGQIQTDLELTKGLRLQQIVSGYCPNDEGEIHEFTGNARITATSELLEQLSGNHKIIIWACFRQNFSELELLCTKLRIKYVSVHGGTSGNAKSCEMFERDSGIRVLIGHPKSCGIGVNLTAASYAIFYSRSFSLEDDLQAESRNHRGGSERHGSIVRIDLTTPSTIDEVILEALQNKMSISNAVLKNLKGKHHAPNN